MNVAVIGLGYVGLPLACLVGKKGHTIAGIDIDPRKIEKINSGYSPIKDEYIERNLKHANLRATADFSALGEAEVVIICVPTPVDAKYYPDLSFVESSTRSVAKHLRKGQTIILESTVYPGTTQEIMQPILEQTGLKAGRDFYLAHCPERIDPGNKKWTVENIPRVVGGVDAKSTKKAADFYRQIIEGEIIEVKSCKEAEATKIMENTFRDINIAYMNEMAKSFDKAGIDITEVIKGASSKPFGFMPHYPGCGVGGHCIAVDPYYLINKAKDYGFDHEFLRLARAINNSMPSYTLGLLEEELGKLGKAIKGAKVGVLGLAYKGGIDDMRNSPALEIIKLLKERGAAVETYDPYLIEKSSQKSLAQLVAKTDYLILATNHKEYFQDLPALLKNTGVKIIIDGRNSLALEGFNGIYRGIGKA